MGLTAQLQAGVLIYIASATDFAFALQRQLVLNLEGTLTLELALDANLISNAEFTTDKVQYAHSGEAATRRKNMGLTAQLQAGVLSYVASATDFGVALQLQIIFDLNLAVTVTFELALDANLLINVEFA